MSTQKNSTYYFETAGTCRRWSRVVADTIRKAELEKTADAFMAAGRRLRSIENVSHRDHFDQPAPPRRDVRAVRIHT
jgi:hypothetical protein